MPDPDPLSEEQIKDLARHARKRWVYFVAFWIAAVSAVLAIEFLDVPGRTATAVLVALGLGVIWGIRLQFSKRCPRCRANLGWQVRLGVPDKCARCGVALKKPSNSD